MSKPPDFNGPSPSSEELAAAPIIHLWELREMCGEAANIYGHQLFGFFCGHPAFDDMSYANSSPVEQMDSRTPPRWARTHTRLYRLGQSKIGYFETLNAD